MVSVGVIQTNLNEFVMVSRKDNENDFGLVGGKAEAGETAYECLIREVKEETGLTVTNATLIDMRVYDGQETYCYYINSFISEGSVKETIKLFNENRTDEALVKLGTLEELCDEASSYYDYNMEITNIALDELFDKTFYRIEESNNLSEKVECLFDELNTKGNKEGVTYSNKEGLLGNSTYVEYLFHKAKNDILDSLGY